jgi:hypothetical protein
MNNAVKQPRCYWKAICLIPATALILLAADASFTTASWKDKPVQGWTDQDARQILKDSPWAKSAVGNISRMQTEFERREGGNMGQEKGVGFDGIDEKTRRQQAAGFFGSAVNGTSNISRPLPLQIRWESALPIRLAELKANVIEPPTLTGDGYRLAVYGVPGNYFKDDPQKLGAPLKKEAALRRAGRDDVKPSSVEVFQREDGLVVVYLFPLSAELTKKDGLIEFNARIGRLGIQTYFDAAEMLFQGKLEI